MNREQNNSEWHTWKKIQIAKYFSMMKNSVKGILFFSLQPISVLTILIAIYMEAATKKLNNVYVILDGIVNKIVQVDYAIMTLTAITKKLVMVLFANVTTVGIGMHQEIAQVIILSSNLASIIVLDHFSTDFYSETWFYSIHQNSASQYTFFLPQYFHVSMISLIVIIEVFATMENVSAILDGKTKLIALVSYFKVAEIFKHCFAHI